MSVWIRNLKHGLEHRSVLILHGNVRDKYIDEHRHVYENLTALLQRVAGDLPEKFTEITLYDPVGKARVAGVAYQATQEPPSRTLTKWADELKAADRNRFIVAFYLDKLVAYKTSYDDTEKEILLRLEKLIENIRPNHRLVLVALQDTMVPVELYRNSPKTYVLTVPRPETADRLRFIIFKLGEGSNEDERRLRKMVADLTDGMYLRDLDKITDALSRTGTHSESEVCRLINIYRIGEQTDYWSELTVERLRGMHDWFVNRKGVLGQNEAITEVQDMLCYARAGLSGLESGTLSKPKGTLFFAGPTGVGKTFVAKKLAEFLFSTEEAFLRFDMSELKEAHTVSKLIGSPPGYVSSEQGGMLTNAVRDRPFSVILFDEIEKAHPLIMDIFLQILDEGRLTDSRGQTVFFTETVIIFTSNIGTRSVDSRGKEITEDTMVKAIRNNAQMSPEQKKEALREHFKERVEHFFAQEISRPELLNRIGDNIVPFNGIDDPAIMSAIFRAHFDRIRTQFADCQRAAGHQLEVDDSTVPWLVAKYQARIIEFGARGIVNAIKKQVMKKLAYPILEAEERRERGRIFRVVPAGDQLTITG